MAALLIAKNVPPPNKLKRGKYPEGSPDEEAGESEDEERDEDESSGVSMMQELMDELKGGDAKAAYQALCRILDSHGG